MGSDAVSLDEWLLTFESTDCLHLQRPVFLNSLTLEDEGTTIVRNIRNYSSSDKSPFPQKDCNQKRHCESLKTHIYKICLVFHMFISWKPEFIMKLTTLAIHVYFLLTLHTAPSSGQER
jgi:hypothetical protein